MRRKLSGAEMIIAPVPRAFDETLKVFLTDYPLPKLFESIRRYTRKRLYPALHEGWAY
jgi:hypothetical protein